MSKSSSKSNSTVIAVIITALVVGFGVYWWQNNQAIIFENPSESLPDTSNWQTFNDKEYHFSIKYPETWAVQYTRAEDVGAGTGLNVFIEEQSESQRGDNVRIFTKELSPNETLADFIDYLESEPMQKLEKSDVTIYYDFYNSRNTLNDAVAYFITPNGIIGMIYSLRNEDRTIDTASKILAGMSESFVLN
jgi:hypothetical protein